jgi:hypothetical protein
LGGVPLALATALAVTALILCWWAGLSAATGFFGMVLGYLSTLWLVALGYWTKLPQQLMGLIPGVGAALAYQRQKRENEIIQETMEKVLEVQEIGGDPANTVKGCAHQLSVGIGLRQRIRRCAECAADRLSLGDTEPFPPWILELLYYEWTGTPAGNLWPLDDERRHELASMLLTRSGRFTRWRERLDMETEDLAWLLKRMGTRGFSLHAIVGRLREIQEVWNLEKAFLAFLKENELVRPETLLDLATTVKRIESINAGQEEDTPPGAIRDLPVGDRTRLLGLLDLGKTGLRDRRAEIPDDELERRVLLTMIVFATRTFTVPRVRSAACHLLATRRDGKGVGAGAGGGRQPWRREGVRLAWSYLVTKEEFRNGTWDCSKPFVCLGEFFNEWTARVAERSTELGSSFDLELRPLYRSLLDGNWLISKDELMNRVFSRQIYTERPSSPFRQTAQDHAPETSTRTAGAPDELLHHFPEVDEMLRKLASQVDLTTVERYVETRRVMPYLITLGPSSGPLPRLLDSLTSAGKRDALVRAGIDVETSRGEAVYNFRPYTPYTRVGLVPAEVSFTAFARGFREDVARLIEHQQDILPATLEDPVGEYYEVLLHGFNPAASNPLGFGKPKGDGAMQRIKELFAERLEPEQLLSLLVYAGLPGRPGSSRLLDILLTTPLAEPTREWDELAPGARKALTEAQNLIRDDLFAALDEAEIDRDDTLLPDSESRMLATERLAAAVRRRVPDLTDHDDLTERIAAAYLAELRRHDAKQPLSAASTVLIDAPTRRWDDVSDDDRAKLDQVDLKVKRDLLASLGVADEKDERKLLRQLEEERDGGHRSVDLVADSIRRHARPLAERPDLVDRIAEAFVETLRAEAKKLVVLQLTLGRSVLIGGQDRVGAM